MLPVWLLTCRSPDWSPAEGGRDFVKELLTTARREASESPNWSAPRASSRLHSVRLWQISGKRP
jgi:hypothetical protein